MAPAVLRILGVAAIAVIGGTGCENKAIGRQCDLLVDGGPTRTTFNPQALECPSRICVQPAVDVNKSEAVDTAPLCSAECSTDDDCKDGEGRNVSKTSDLRCKSGFACGIASEVGDFCCKKICLCRDFLVVPDGGLQVPAGCDPGNPVNHCKNLPGRT
jgi:hypothetical protein